jgi:ribosomal protein RSM22 (predicted rRNA methylase)
MSSLPTWISAALASRLENVSRGTLRERAQAISDTYRAGGRSDIIGSELDALAYAVVRMPATYAAIRAALGHTIEIVPDFQPRSILDVGAGPGTASWASIDTWPLVQRTTLVDRNPRLLELARQLHGAIQRTEIAADFVQGDLARSPGGSANADVVMASYAFTELAPAALTDVLAALWRHAERLLVIVEPGTVDGSKRILACRDILVANGATIIAPCSHQNRCPLSENARWCHFATRLARSRDHMIVKDAQVPFEDEKFSYLVAGKGFADIPKGRRVLATPKVSKASITLTLCAPDRPEERTLARRDKEAYKAAKRLDWGDAVEISGSPSD